MPVRPQRQTLATRLIVQPINTQVLILVSGHTAVNGTISPHFLHWVRTLAPRDDVRPASLLSWPAQASPGTMQQMNNAHVHGYGRRKVARLLDQAATLVGLLHCDTFLAASGCERALHS